MFDPKSGGRVGSFDRSSVMEQDNCWVTCGGEAATSDTRKKDKRFNNLRLKWTAPADGVGSITFKCTLIPKNLADPDLVRMYGLNVSLEETMPPRKHAGSGFASSSRRFDFKPKIELAFDVAFNHNHMLQLFEQNELNLVEHFFTPNAKCTLPLGKLGVQKVKGAREVIDLLVSMNVLGPNQIMKNVKPMDPKETVIESRTIVIRDELPGAKLSMQEIYDAEHSEVVDILSADDEVDPDSDTFGVNMNNRNNSNKNINNNDDNDIDNNHSTADTNNNNNQANPNEGDSGHTLSDNNNSASNNDNDSDNEGRKSKRKKKKSKKQRDKESQLVAAAAVAEAQENESPEVKILRKQFQKIAMKETEMIFQMQRQKMICANEVRNVHLPAKRAKKIENFQEERDELVYDGHYGGSTVHLQMKLPANYPANARPYDLAAQAAQKGKEVSERSEASEPR